jgi:N-ethylmaleimide reductase
VFAPLIAAAGYTGESAAAIGARRTMLTSLRSATTSPRTPDVPERLRGELPLNRYNRSNFFGREGRG